jgi:FkbM family methyltransferase
VGWAVRALARRYESLHLAPVRMNDGRVLYLDLRELMCMPYLLMGDYSIEVGETLFIKSLLRKGDIVIDIGANCGWYSTLFSELVGLEGTVYAFEPNPKAVQMLTATAGNYRSLRVIAAALSDREGAAHLYVPVDGVKASLGDVQEEQVVQTCAVTTLDAFVKSQGAGVPAFIKCDAEGAEMAILRGATNILANDQPPVWLMELSTVTAARFGFHPAQLVEFFREIPNAGYRCYSLDSVSGKLELISPSTMYYFFNAVFVPACHEERLARYLANSID